MNVKTVNILYYALSRIEMNRILSCNNSRDIWNPLKMTHERAKDTSKGKTVDMLVHQYKFI